MNRQFIKIEALSMALAQFDSDELAEIKTFAIEVMAVRKGRRDSVRRALDVAFYLVLKNLEPKNLNVVHGRQNPGAENAESKNQLSASPYASEADHIEHMIGQGNER